ncbi:hypothetical protein Tco_0671002 [Tanacetum coccineum]
MAKHEPGDCKSYNLLAQYLFMHAEGRKSEARLSGGLLQRGPERQSDAAGLVAPEPLRLEGEVQELRRSVVGLRGDVAQSITNQGRGLEKLWLLVLSLESTTLSTHGP